MICGDNMRLLLKNIKHNSYKDVSDYLAEGSKISWYDVSKNSGRDVSNANGDMILNVINDKYRVDIVTIPMNKNQFLDFFSEITPNPRIYAKFNDPFTGQEKECLMYRGDRSSEEQWAITENNVVYKGVSLAIIEL